MTAPLIMFDGPDGIGKTTQLGLVKQRAGAVGMKVYTSRVLGGTVFGEALRGVMLGETPRGPLADLHVVLAMAADLQRELADVRQTHDLILIDRSPLSILGFQVAGSGLDQTLGKQGADTSMSYLHPDLILVYQATLPTLQQRLPALGQKGSGDYFEDQDLGYHQRVIDGYDKALALYPPATPIDASGTPEQVLQASLEVISRKLGIKL